MKLRKILMGLAAVVGFTTAATAATRTMPYRLSFNAVGDNGCAMVNDSTDAAKGSVAVTQFLSGYRNYNGDAKDGKSHQVNSGTMQLIADEDNGEMLASGADGYVIAFWMKNYGEQNWRDDLGLRIGKVANFGLERCTATSYSLYGYAYSEKDAKYKDGEPVIYTSSEPRGNYVLPIAQDSWTHVAIRVPAGSGAPVVYVNGVRICEFYTTETTAYKFDIGDRNLYQVLFGCSRSGGAATGNNRNRGNGQVRFDEFAIYTGEYSEEDMAWFAKQTIAALPPVATDYTTAIGGDDSFANVKWNPDKPEGGFAELDTLTVTNTAAGATFTLDEALTAAKFAIVSEADKATTLAKGDVALAVAAYDFSAAAGKSTLAFAPGAANITAGADTVLNATGTGTLTIGADNQATVPDWSGASLSGAGTVVFNAADAETAITPGAFAGAFTGAIRLTQGTWTCSADYPQQRPVTLSGENAKFILNKQDGMGYGSGLPAFTVEDGATFEVDKRDTFNRNLILNNGHFVCLKDDNDGGRSFDFYKTSALTVSGTSTIGGLTAESTTGSGILAIRRSDFTVTVESGAELQCYSAWATENGNGGNFYKAGAGKMVQYRDSACALPFVVQGGTLKFVDGGRTTTAGITLNSGMKLELSATDDGEYTLGNAISGEGRVEKQDGGTYKLTGANTYTGGTTVKAGTLEVTSPTGEYTVDEGATLKCELDVSAGGEFDKPVIAANEGTVAFKVTMSRDEIQSGTSVAVADLDEGIESTEGFAAVVINADTLNEVDCGLSIEDNVLYVTPQGEKQSHEFVPEESGSFTWQGGVEIGDLTYRDYDDIAFATTVYTTEVAVASRVAATDVSVGGTYVFTGSPVIASSISTLEGADATFENDLVAESVSLTDGKVLANSIVASDVAVENATFGAKVIGPSMKFVRLTITETQGGAANQRPAVGEFRLYRGSKTTGYSIVDWPVGTKVSDSTGLVATKETADYPAEVGAGLGKVGGNEGQPGDLIDGYYGNHSSPKIYGTGGYNTPAYNKWWPDTQKDGGPWTVTIEFPYPVATFSGCNFCLADHAPRNPTAWTIEVSSDGQDWVTVNETEGAEWSSGQYAWGGGDENAPAFLNADTTPTTVTVNDGATVLADGNWTAALQVEGNVTFKGVAGERLTLDAASTSYFGIGAELTFDLNDYDVTKAGKQYIIAGPTEGWPSVTDITVIPYGKFELDMDEEGYFVVVKSGNYWLGDQEGGVGTWDLANTMAWGADAETSEASVWLNGVAANFTRDGTVTVSGGVEPTAVNITSNDGVAVTFTGALSALAGVPFNIGSTNDTLTVDNADALALQAVSAVADANFTLTKAGEGELTLPAVDFGGGDLNVNAGTVKFTDKNSFQNAGTITIAGTLDLNGAANYEQAFVLGAGGTLANTGTAADRSAKQITGLTLDGNATVNVASKFGLIGPSYNPTTLTLNGNTLVKTGAERFWLSNTTVDDGTIDLQEGIIDTIGNKGATTIPGTLNIAADAEFVSSGIVTNGTVTGAGTLSGKVTITTKLMGTVNTTATVTFADGATLDLTGCEYEEGDLIVRWTAKPTDLNIVGYAGTLELKQFEDGLYAVGTVKCGDHVFVADGDSTWTATSFGGGEDNYRDPSKSATFNDGTAETATITIDGTRKVDAFVIDNADTEYVISNGNFIATTFEKKGTGTATLLVGADTKPGAATITAGTLIVGTDAMNNTYKFQADSIVVKSGATLDVRSRDVFFKTQTVTVEKDALLTTSGFNTLSGVTLSGGTIESVAGYTAGWKSWCLNDTLTVNGDVTSYITTGATPGSNYGLQLSTGIFDVQGASTLEVSTPMQDGPGDRGTLQNQVRKTGTGTMVVKVNPTYTGITDIQEGTYVLDCESVTGKSYAVAGGALLNAGKVRGLTVSGDGTIVATLTDAEYEAGKADIFTGTGTLKVWYNDEDITEKCTIEGGSITAIEKFKPIVPGEDAPTYQSEEEAQAAAEKAVVARPTAVESVISAEDYNALFKVVPVDNGDGTWTIAPQLTDAVAEAEQEKADDAQAEIAATAATEPSATVQTQAGLYYGIAGAEAVGDVADTEGTGWVLGDGTEKTVTIDKVGTTQGFYQMRVSPAPSNLD